MLTMKSAELKVAGMSCGHCVKAIEDALRSMNVKGKADLAARTVTVEFDEEQFTLGDIKEAIIDQGYEVQ